MRNYAIPFVGVLIETGADVLLRIYIKNNNFMYLYSGIILYGLSGLFFVNLLRMHNFGTSNILWHITHFFILFFISLFYFKEKYSKKELLGLVFGLLSLYLFSTSKNHNHLH